MQRKENDDDLELKINELSKWLIENGLNPQKIKNIHIQTSSKFGEGRCLISKRYLPPGTYVAEVPKAYLINYRHAFVDGRMAVLLRWTQRFYEQSVLTRLDALVLLLIYSKFYPVESTPPLLFKFAPTLPCHFDTPEYFDADLIDLLPAHVKAMVKPRLAELHAKYEKIMSLLNKYAETKSHHDPDIPLITWEQLRWAFCSMNSRVFYIDEEELCSEEEIEMARKYFGDLAEMSEENTNWQIKSFQDYKDKSKNDYNLNNNFSCMAPLIDFANHSDAPNVCGHFNRPLQCYQFKSTKPIRAGEQVLVTYGFHDNQTLLVEYGFVMESNAYDKLVFCLDDLESMLDYMDVGVKQAVLDQSIEEKLFDDLSCDQSGGPSQSLCRFLDLVANSKSDGELTEDHEKIRLLFIDLLRKYENYLTSCQPMLNDYLTTTNHKDHAEMVLKLINIQLNIIHFNLDLASNISNWLDLF